MEAFVDYQSAIAAFAVVGGLQFVQLLVADVAGLKNGHVPGKTPEATHRSFHFRSVRTVANMNESLGIFIIFLVAGILSGADPVWFARCAWAYTIARIVYAFCYWFNIKTMRSIVFGVALLGLLGMGLLLFPAIMG